MSFTLTTPAFFASQQTNVKPVILLAIEGVSTKYGSASISEKIRIGDSGLYIDNYLGDPWFIGGNRPLLDQGTYIALGSSQAPTTTKITQQLDPDKGLGSSVSQLTISMVDIQQAVGRLITPGEVVTEILGRKCKVQIGFQGLAYPQDYITIFRGIIEKVDPGSGFVTFYLSSNEQQKRQQLFIRQTGKLASSISDVGSVSTISLSESATNFPVPHTGPDGSYDSSIKFYVQINDEFFQYTGTSGSTLTGVTRNPSPFDFGQQAHSIDDDVTAMVRLEGNGLDLARKIMMSGVNGYYLSSLDVQHFGYLSASETLANSIFFFGVNISDEYGIFEGDYITTAGASNGANNVSAKVISEVGVTNDGSYIVVSGVSFVGELNSSATISFRSKWDTLGYGCQMTPNDVDLYEFDRLYRLFLSSFDYDFRLKDGIEAKSFIEEQIFRPMASYSILRKGKSSVGYHIGPLPGANLTRLNLDNVTNPSKLKPSRSITKNYYNTINFDYDLDVNDSSYKNGRFSQDTTSVLDFGNRIVPISIKSDGMRSDLGAPTLANSASNRLLTRYKRAAESINGIEVIFKDGVFMEIGDIVIVDYESLKLTDIKNGGIRSGQPRLFQVINKTLDLEKGTATLNLTDTGFSTDTRYGLISPASKIKSVTSSSVFDIKSSYSESFGVNEYLKWQRFGQIYVRVRSEDGVTRNAVRLIDQVVGNTVYLSSALPFTPIANDIMEFSHYNDASEDQKLVYVFMRNTDPFDDGKNRYNML